jgi:hypothetical protein
MVRASNKVQVESNAFRMVRTIAAIDIVLFFVMHRAAPCHSTVKPPIHSRGLDLIVFFRSLARLCGAVWILCAPSKAATGCEYECYFFLLWLDTTGAIIHARWLFPILYTYTNCNVALSHHHHRHAYYTRK